MILNGNTITAKGWAKVFGKIKLMEQFTFTAKFINISSRVSLGVRDTRNRDKVYGNWNKNFIFYYNNGYCDVDGDWKKNQGIGFKEGEIVTVNVDLNSGSIQWEINSQIRHQVSTPILKDHTISWVPYI